MGMPSLKLGRIKASAARNSWSFSLPKAEPMKMMSDSTASVEDSRNSPRDTLDCRWPMSAQSCFNSSRCSPWFHPAMTKIHSSFIALVSAKARIALARPFFGWIRPRNNSIFREDVSSSFWVVSGSSTPFGIVAIGPSKPYLRIEAASGGQRA